MKNRATFPEYDVLIESVYSQTLSLAKTEEEESDSDEIFNYIFLRNTKEKVISTGISSQNITETTYLRRIPPPNEGTVFQS